MRTSLSALDVTWEVSETLAGAALPSPGADARILVAHVLGVEVKQMLTAPPLDEEQLRRLDELVNRRLAGEPVQHITGQAHFRYETLAVGPGVFIPRPETEPLVDLALDVLGRRPVGRRRVVELGAGSGAITLSLAREMGGLDLHAVELSAEAWPWLTRNLEGVDVDLVHADMATAFEELVGTVDLVVSNPPYVPDGHRRLMPDDVLGHDPDIALFSGPDGLDAVRVVRDRALRLLRPGGFVVMEHDESHADRVRDLFGGPGFDETSMHDDLAGRPRHVLARRAQVPDVAGLGA